MPLHRHSPPLPLLPHHPRSVVYHDAACQKKHWHAGHKQQCQDVSSGGLDWAAEAAAAQAGLAAWEEEEPGAHARAAQQAAGC